jgi:TRAP-type C4-dicarboxylate transport system permease small subunit
MECEAVAVNWVRGSLSNLDRTLAFAMRSLCVVCIVLLLVLLTGNVLFRFVPIMSMGWYDEIVEMLFAWLVFIGAAVLWRENSHFRVEWLSSKLENRTAGHVLGVIVELISLFFLAVMTHQGLRLTLLANDWTPILKLPKRLLYLDIPIAGSLMIAYGIRNIVHHILLLKARSAGYRPE